MKSIEYTKFMLLLCLNKRHAYIRLNIIILFSLFFFHLTTGSAGNFSRFLCDWNHTFYYH